MEQAADVCADTADYIAVLASENSVGRLVWRIKNYLEKLKTDGKVVAAVSPVTVDRSRP